MAASLSLFLILIWLRKSEKKRKVGGDTGELVVLVGVKVQKGSLFQGVVAFW